MTMDLKDRKNTSLFSPWGTFRYNKVPFDLIDAKTTPQKAMDIKVGGERDRSIQIYRGDIEVPKVTQINPVLELSGEENPK